MNKSITIFSATKQNRHEDLEIWKYMKKFTSGTDPGPIEGYIKTNNTTGLPTLYNKELERSDNKDKILVFAHDDLFIQDGFLHEKLNEAMEQFDIIGLAGIKAPIEIKSPAAWHLMGKPEQYSGAVAHYKPNDAVNQWMTSFGPTPERVILIDGVFIAVNVEKVLNAGVRFDEDFAFHHYDLPFCLAANQKKLKIGTWPIYTTHRGLGTSMLTPEWKESEKEFLEKYA